MDLEEIITNLQSASEEYVSSISNGNENEMLLRILIDAVCAAKDVGISKDDIKQIIYSSAANAIQNQPTHVELNCDIV